MTHWTSTKTNIESLASAFGETGTQKAKGRIDVKARQEHPRSRYTKNESSDKSPSHPSSTRRENGCLLVLNPRFSFLVPNLEIRPTDTNLKILATGQEVSFEECQRNQS